MNVLLDTNILTRWVNSQDAHHNPTVQSLRLLRTSGHVPSLVPQNLYEFWVVATRPLDANGLALSAADAEVELDRLRAPLFQLYQDERAILPRWRELVENYQVHGKSAHDARLVAAMLRHGVTYLLTFNVPDFTRYSEITAIHPDDLVSGSATLPLENLASSE